MLKRHHDQTQPLTPSFERICNSKPSFEDIFHASILDISLSDVMQQQCSARRELQILRFAPQKTIVNHIRPQHLVAELLHVLLLPSGATVVPFILSLPHSGAPRFFIKQSGTTVPPARVKAQILL